MGDCFTKEAWQRITAGTESMKGNPTFSTMTTVSGHHNETSLMTTTTTAAATTVRNLVTTAASNITSFMTTKASERTCTGTLCGREHCSESGTLCCQPIGLDNFCICDPGYGDPECQTKTVGSFQAGLDPCILQYAAIPLLLLILIIIVVICCIRWKRRREYY